MKDSTIRRILANHGQNRPIIIGAYTYIVERDDNHARIWRRKTNEITNINGVITIPSRHVDGWTRVQQKDVSRKRAETEEVMEHQQELSATESYAWGIIRVLYDAAFEGCAGRSADDLPPTAWLGAAHPTTSSVGAAYKLIARYVMERLPLNDEGVSAIARVSDVMDLSGLGLRLGDIAQKPGPEYVLGESVARARGVEEAMRQLGEMIGDAPTASAVTLPQYAIKHGKPDITVRKAAIEGRLKTARKVGGRWVIDPNEPWPEDGRRTK